MAAFEGLYAILSVRSSKFLFKNVFLPNSFKSIDFLQLVKEGQICEEQEAPSMTIIPSPGDFQPK